MNSSALSEFDKIRQYEKPQIYSYLILFTQIAYFLPSRQ